MQRIYVNSLFFSFFKRYFVFGQITWVRCINLQLVFYVRCQFTCKIHKNVIFLWNDSFSQWKNTVFCLFWWKRNKRRSKCLRWNPFECCIAFLAGIICDLNFRIQENSNIHSTLTHQLVIRLNEVSRRFYNQSNINCYENDCCSNDHYIMIVRHGSCSCSANFALF